jgi:hypothetical protein
MLLLAALLFAGVFQIQNAINTDRTRMGLTKVAPLENAPPVLAFTTVALGGFRGLIANALWIRLSDLQDNDKFFEMVQLSDWITKLEPHFVQVWLMQGWNMAYNISVKFKDPEDRWRWVQRGIALLRDDGLKYNPDEALIYREISWFYQHKMGNNLDDAQRTYKVRWAEEMESVFGDRPNFAELENPTTDDARRRVKLLKEKYKLDPAVMAYVDREYGPLEWRLPDAHAIYWAELGRRKAKPKDQETLRRSIYQTMQQACIRGGLNKTRTGQWVWGPNLDLVPKVSAAYEKMISEEPAIRDNMQTAHRNFLRTAVYLLYVDGRQKQAQYWYDYIRKQYPHALPPDLSLDDYALSSVTEEVNDTEVNRVLIIIQGFVRQSFMRMMNDEDDSATNYERLAKRLYERHQEKTPGTKGRIDLPPYSDIRKQVLDELLQVPQYAPILRTKLNLPAPTGPTNTPAATTKP